VISFRLITVADVSKLTSVLVDLLELSEVVFKIRMLCDRPYRYFGGRKF
jgi:hypothetical protein